MKAATKTRFRRRDEGVVRAAILNSREARRREVVAAKCQKIWAAIPPLAERYRMDPAFLYALVPAESNFDPMLCIGARGVLQITPYLGEPFRLKRMNRCWELRINLSAGVDCLVPARSSLHQKNVFS